MYSIVQYNDYIVITFKGKNLYTIFNPPTIKESENTLKLRDGLPSEVMNIILNFEQVIKNNPNFNMNNFYNRINTAGIYLTEPNPHHLTGHYELESNNIYIPKNNLSLLNHELLHLSTTNLQKHVNQSGFYFYNKYSKQSFFKQINEGQTSLFDKKYFNYKYDMYDYNLALYILKLVNEELGSNIVENCYSKMDLVSLFLNLNTNNLLTEFIILSSYLELLPKNEGPTLEKLKLVHKYLIEFQGKRLNSNISDDKIKEVIEEQTMHFRSFTTDFGTFDFNSMAELKKVLELK